MPRLRHHSSSAVVLLLAFAFYTECASKVTCVTNVESECEVRIDGLCYCNAGWLCYKSVTILYNDVGVVDSHTKYGCLGGLANCEKEIVLESSSTVLTCCNYDNCSVDLELSVNDALNLLSESSSQAPTPHVNPSAVLHSAATTPTNTATSSEGTQHSVWSVVLWITVPVIAVVLSTLLIILIVQLTCTRKRLKDMAKVRQAATNNSVIKVQYV